MSALARFARWKARRRARRENLLAIQMYREHKGRYSIEHCLEAVRGKQ